MKHFLTTVIAALTVYPVSGLSAVGEARRFRGDFALGIRQTH
ncbi:hypothetical protein [Propionivibrio sp.]|nr:hypothetical protein [Propionivibrio sp.]